MAENETRALATKYRNVAAFFVKGMAEQNELECALVTGSYYTGTLCEASDLDVFLVTAAGGMRERGVRVIQGVKIAYVMNPLWKVEQLLVAETGELKRPTAEMVFFSKCLLGETLSVRLRMQAGRALRAKSGRLRTEEVAYHGWKLYDKSHALRRGHADVVNKEFLTYDLFYYVIDVFFLIKRSYQPHAKYRLAKILALDKAFYDRVRRFLVAKKGDREKHLMRIVDYVLKMLEFRALNYRRRSRAR